MATFRASYDRKAAISRPTRSSLTHTLRRNFHWKCLLATLLVHACMLYAIDCHFAQRYGSGIFTAATSIFSKYGVDGVRFCAHAGHALAPALFAAILYLVYLAECWHYRRTLLSLPTHSSAQIYELAQRMRDAIPIVWWKSVCYHYLRRTRQVTRYRNGDAITATQVYYERVNSHSSGNVFHYDSCGYKDITKRLVDLNQYSLIRMRFTKGFVFACVQAADEFDEQRTRFFNENEVRDDYMEVREGLDLAGVPFIEHVLVYASDENRADTNNDQEHTAKWALPWYLRSMAFWTASILLLSWPLRMLIECRTAHLTFQVTKLFGSNYLSPSSINYTGPLTRTSTMESAELELINRDNYILVPSYSEAILLDPINNYNNHNHNHGEMNTVRMLNTLRNGHCTSQSHPNSTEISAQNESGEALILTNYGTIDDSSINRIANDRYENLNGANYNNYSNSCHNNSRCYHASDAVSYSPYCNTLQRIFAGVSRAATRRPRDFGSEFFASPYRRLDNFHTQRRFSPAALMPPQLRSQSMMSFFAGAKSVDTLTKTRAIPRQSQPRAGIAQKLNSQHASRVRKPPSRSITFAEGMPLLPARNNSQTARDSYEYSRRIADRQSAALAAARCNACNGVVIERGTRRIVAIGGTPNASPFRRALNGALIMPYIGVDEPPPPYELALRMCAPLYERLRRSTASISSLLSLFANNNNNNNNHNNRIIENNVGTIQPDINVNGIHENIDTNNNDENPDDMP